MGDFIRTATLTVILTIYGLFHTDNPSFLLCAAGLLMLVFTLENLSEERGIVLMAVKILLMAVCVGLTDGFLMFLLFGQVGFHKSNVFLPPLLFFAVRFIDGVSRTNGALAATIVQACLLALLSLLTWYAQKLERHNMERREQLDAAISKLALNELAERKLNRALALKNRMIERNARLEEREKISCNIHNSVGHTITAAVVALDAAEVLWSVDSKRAFDKVKTARERISLSLDSIRRAVRVLDQEAETVSVDDFRMEIQAMIDHFMIDTDRNVLFDYELIDNELMIPHEHTEFLTGAVEELLTNGIKHGGADRFTVRIQADSSHLRVIVSDNGISDFSCLNQAQRIQNGFGIRKMIQYIDKNGGNIALYNENGFHTQLMLPIGSTTGE